MNIKRIRIINYAVIILFGSLITWINKNYKLDDALIYYRYIENFINNNGLVYNIGEKFNALTSPLYIYISILFSFFTKEIELTQIILNGILIVSAGIALAYLFYFLNKPNLAFLSSAIYITSRYFYTVFGMETNLFVFISLLCIIFYFKKSFLNLTIASALLVLTRGEGIFLLIILFSLMFYENKSSIKLSYIFIFILILTSNYLYNYFYYNQLLPQTMSSKLYQSQSGLWGTGYSFILNFNYLFKIAYNNQPFFILNILILGLIGFANHIKEKVCLILFLFTIAITIFHLALNIQSYHWYYAIHFLTFIVFISYGVLDVVKIINTKFSVKWKKYVLLTLIFIFSFLTQIELFRLLNREGPHLGYKTAGEWLNQNTPIDSKVACVEVGHIGWYSKRYIVDILGLVNPNLSKYLGEHDFSKWYDLYKPDYIVIHEPLAGAELLADKYIKEGIYIKENRFTFPGIAIFKRTVP